MVMTQNDPVKRRNMLKLVFGAFLGSGAYAFSNEIARARSAILPRNFNTFTELRTVSDLADIVDGDVVVLHQSAEDDRGGGIFRWNPYSQEADDNAMVIRPQNVPEERPGRFVRVHSDSIDACWFGAKGDDVADDSQAIQ